MNKKLLIIIVILCVAGIALIFALRVLRPAQELPLPYQTIEDAVRASGGTYFVIDPNNASGSDVADTIFGGGLTNSDGGGNLTLVPGITLHDKIENRFLAKAYYIKPKKSFTATLVVESKGWPFFLTLFNNDGSIIDVDYGKRVELTADFLAGETYTAEVSIVHDTLPDNFEAIDTSYSIGFENAKPL